LRATILPPTRNPSCDATGHDLARQLGTHVDITAGQHNRAHGAHVFHLRHRLGTGGQGHGQAAAAIRRRAGRAVAPVSRRRVFRANRYFPLLCGLLDLREETFRWPDGSTKNFPHAISLNL
jgi:hypothetical protein